MIAKTLLLLLSAQLGLAKLDFPINRLVISDPPPVGSTSSSAGSGEGGHGPSEGLNLGAIDTDVDELELVLTDQKIWFTINVTFGNGLEGEDEDRRAARTHTLVLDSGSQDLWIMESGCTSQNCGWNETLGPPAGYTHLPSGENNFIPWKREYYGTASAGQTNVSGFDVNDTISLGGPEDAVDMTFSVANIVQGLPVGNTFQGIFPIGPARYGITNDSSADSDPKKGPLRMLRKAGVISNEDIGFSLSPAKPSLTIGGINEAFTYDSLGMANVTSTRFTKYVVPVDSIMVAGRSVASNTTNQYLEAWIDTGVTYWNAPQEMWQAFYQSIPGGMFSNDSDGRPPRGILPATPQGDVNVAITIGGKTFVLDYSSLINTDTMLFPNDNKDLRYGTLLNSRVTDSPNQWVFGASFLENVYVSFNPYWNRVCIWPLSDADKGTPAVSPPQRENKDEQPVQGPTHRWGEVPEKTEALTMPEETSASSSTNYASEPSATANEELVVGSSTDGPTQAPDQPTMTTSWSLMMISTHTPNIAGRYTWDVTAMTSTWVPVEVAVTPTVTSGPWETAPTSFENPEMKAWESNPAQTGVQKEDSASPSESWLAEQSAESNTGDNPTSEHPEEGAANQDTTGKDGGGDA